ncbi:hypothetical protein AVEN_85735-1, partial [Araneus ventricosus]
APRIKFAPSPAFGRAGPGSVLWSFLKRFLHSGPDY